MLFRSPRTLTATIEPSTATNPIVWSIIDAGGTGAIIVGDKFIAQSEGTATVKAAVQDGIACGIDFEEIFDIVVNTVGIVETGSAPSLQIYPNPVNSELKITNYEGGEVQIYDIMGRFVNNCQLSIVNSQLIINVSHLPTGIYFLRIGEKAAKFVKE